MAACKGGIGTNIRAIAIQFVSKNLCLFLTGETWPHSVETEPGNTEVLLH